MSDTATSNEVVEEVPKQEGEEEIENGEAAQESSAQVNGDGDAATNEQNLHPLGKLFFPRRIPALMWN